MEHLVSVIIPVYNTAFYIEKCIYSVLSQDYPNIEIILVNDCSTDNSAAICDQFAIKYTNISCIHHEKNLGLSATRNSGLTAVKGDYVLFLDSDDTLLPNTISILASYLETTKSELAICNYQYNVSGVVSPNKNQFNNGMYPIQYFLSQIYELYMANWLSCVGTKLYRYSIIKKHSLRFDDALYKYNEDIAFICNYLEYTQNVYVSSHIGYNYVKRNNSIQQSIHPHGLISIFRARSTLSNILIKFNLWDNKKELFAKDLSILINTYILSQWENYKDFCTVFNSIKSYMKHNPFFEVYYHASSIYEKLYKTLLRNDSPLPLYLYVLLLRFIKDTIIKI